MWLCTLNLLYASGTCSYVLVHIYGDDVYWYPLPVYNSSVLVVLYEFTKHFKVVNIPRRLIIANCAGASSLYSQHGTITHGLYNGPASVCWLLVLCSLTTTMISLLSMWLVCGVLMREGRVCVARPAGQSSVVMCTARNLVYYNIKKPNNVMIYQGVNTVDYKMRHKHIIGKPTP